MTRKTCLMSVFGAALFVAAGCSENLVTRQHYDMIMVGKSNRSEVKLTLGDTYIDRGGFWEYDETDRHLSVVVHFDQRDLVKKKEWVDGKTGEWDTDPPDPSQGEKISDESSNMTIKKP